MIDASARLSRHLPNNSCWKTYVCIDPYKASEKFGVFFHKFKNKISY